MKRKLAAVLAGVMVLTMGMATVFAATSPTTSDEGQAAVDEMVSGYEGLGGVDAATASYSEEDETYTITVSAADAEELGLVEGETYYIFVGGVAVEATYTSDGFVVSASDITLEDGVDYAVEVYGASEEESENTEDSEDENTEDSEDENTEDSEDENTEDSEDEEGSEDESAATSSEDDSNAASTGSDDSSSTAGTSSTGSDSTASPKTGAAAALPLLAVAALAGVVVCGKKVKFYE